MIPSNKKPAVAILWNSDEAYSVLMENIDYDPVRNIDRNQIDRFANYCFLKQKENILIT